MIKIVEEIRKNKDAAVDTQVILTNFYSEFYSILLVFRFVFLIISALL